MPESSELPRIATFGDINIDVILDVDDLPRRGDEVFSTGRRELLGGSAANTAVVLRRLGFPVTIMGAVGDDEPGRQALRRLAALDVDTDRVVVSKTHPTAMNTVLVTPDHERTMVGARGANVHYTGDADWPSDVDWLHVSGYALMEGPQRVSAVGVLDEALEAGLPCSLDVPVGVGGKIRETISGQLSGLRLLSGSRPGLEQLTGSGEPMERLRGGPDVVAMTAGDGPLSLFWHGNQVRLTPPRVDVVDVTGAGDAFIAGLIAADITGLDPGPAAVLAAVTGAAATVTSGASRTLSERAIWPSLLDADRWMEADPSWLDAVRSWASERGLT